MNFENARSATEELFENQPSLEETEPNEEKSIETESREEPDVQEKKEVSEERRIIEESAQMAELAAQTAAEKDAQLKQATQALEEERAKNAQLQETLGELSKRNEEKIAEGLLEPPVLDVSSLAFADPETVQKAQADYAKKMLEYNRQEIMKELSPFVEQAKEGMLIKEKNEMISALAQLPELSDIENMLPQLDRIITNNKALSSDSVPLDEKYITAYAIAKGVNSINTPPAGPKEPTTEELLEIYNSNPDLQAAVEKQRLEQIKQSQQVPPLSSSSGAVNAALNIKDKPKTFEEASERTRRMFGLG